MSIAKKLLLLLNRVGIEIHWTQVQPWLILDSCTQNWSLLTHSWVSSLCLSGSLPPPDSHTNLILRRFVQMNTNRDWTNDACYSGAVVAKFTRKQTQSDVKRPKWPQGHSSHPALVFWSWWHRYCVYTNILSHYSVCVTSHTHVRFLLQAPSSVPMTFNISQ